MAATLKFTLIFLFLLVFTDSCLNCVVKYSNIICKCLIPFSRGIITPITNVSLLWAHFGSPYAVNLIQSKFWKIQGKWNQVAISTIMFWQFWSNMHECWGPTHIIHCMIHTDSHMSYWAYNIYCLNNIIFRCQWQCQMIYDLH